MTDANDISTDDRCATLTTELRGLEPGDYTTAQLYSALVLDGSDDRDRRRLTDARDPLVRSGEFEQVRPRPLATLSMRS